MRQCKACIHQSRARIEDELARRVPHAKIGEHFGLSLDCIWRHSKHLGRSVVCESGRPLIDRVETLMNRLEIISRKAQTAKEWHSAVAAMKEVRCSLELLAKLTGQMPSVGQAVTVGVALNVSTSRPTHELTDRDLDVQIALDVAAATDDFNPRTIEQMKRIASMNRVSDDKLLECPAS